jgi:hypothetical protein
MPPRKKSPEYGKLEAEIETLIQGLVKGLVDLIQREMPIYVRTTLQEKVKIFVPLKKTRRKRSPR